MTFPESYDDSRPEVLARNTQKIFRRVEKGTPDAAKRVQALLLAIEKTMPPLLTARVHSHNPTYLQELAGTWGRPVKDADDSVAAVVTDFNQVNRSGPAGNAVAMY